MKARLYLLTSPAISGNVYIDMNEQTRNTILDALSNDEYSTNEEMLKFFIELGLTETEANEWLSKRSFYLNNIVMNDGTVYKPTLK